MRYPVRELEDWERSRRHAPTTAPTPYKPGVPRSHSYTPPSAERQQVIGLEVLAMVKAARDRDYGRLLEIAQGSEVPVWQHCLEAVTICALLIDSSNDPEGLYAALQDRIVNTAAPAAAD